MSDFQLTPIKSFGFSFPSEVGKFYEIQESSDLVNWESTMKILAQAQMTTFAEATTDDQRFYKVVLSEDTAPDTQAVIDQLTMVNAFLLAIITAIALCKLFPKVS